MTGSSRQNGVLLINFGEPAAPERDAVVSFLERIFLANARLEDGGDGREALRRSRELAERRAPALIEDYRRIGGSPLGTQARDQAAGLEAELARRGQEAAVEVGMQFTEPTLAAALDRLRAGGARRVVALPVYPLCGPSTTVQSLTSVQRALGDMGWEPDLASVTGWHRHPRYLALRARAVRETAASGDLDLRDPGVRLVFSAHGTPLRYLREGSRYVEYVEEWCARLAEELAVSDHVLGYQNHANRGIEWTEPAIEDAVAGIRDAEVIIVDAVSFMHEQSETLVELDLELREVAEERGLSFHRVPIPHSDPDFHSVLADLVELALGREVEAAPSRTRCRCVPGASVCFNGEPAPLPAGAGSTE